MTRYFYRHNLIAMVSQRTIRDLINETSQALTGTERKLSTTLLSDYPFAGLEPIQVLAERTGVSSPSISRFVSKLGFQGYQDFQRQLIQELKASQRSPIELMVEEREVDGSFLGDFTKRASALMEEMAHSITDAQFHRVGTLLSDPNRRVFVLGGRVSDLVAQTLSRHLKRLRDDVFHMESDPETWPDNLLKMRSKDVLFVVDFRRYQQSISDLAKMAANERKANVIVLTDKWLSPAVTYASETLAVPVESGTVWDSYAAGFTLMEALMTRVAESDWKKHGKRVAAWDALNEGRQKQKNDT
ncbi:MurR/RpiR family transcriptional regulator [Roseibium sp. SCP14]|uniref:MurR/RpiR family transcriptional regulator n=1 Tax=Roseibium sp. SCP14 TaxID=3141375 RepID=UPI00333753AE